MPLRIGRGAANDLVLSDSGVSRSHAEVVFEGGGYAIRDVGSSNGTFVDGARVQTAALRTGAKIEVGHALLKFVPARARRRPRPIGWC